MALIKYGGGIIQMSGSIAGNTFARNHYGNYVRARTKPINPNTAHQVMARARLTQLTQRWSQTLTAPQRTAWNLYGSSVAMQNKLGETVYLTGFNHYIRSNTVMLQSGLPAVDNGPVIFELPEADPAFRITTSEATQLHSVAYDDTLAWNNEDNGLMMMYAGSPQNAQRNFFGGPWRYAGGFNGNAGAPPASPQNMTTVFGVAEGQHLWLYARILRVDGRLSQPFRDDVLCGA